MADQELPPGYIFSPTDKELLSYYLKPKVYGEELPCDIIEEKEIYGPNANPWEVFDDSSTSWIISGKFEKIVYVFAKKTKKNKKKSSGVGRERYVKKAGCGRWHGATGPKKIMDRKGGNIIGFQRMLVFEINDVSGLGDMVDINKDRYWKMHEYCLCGYEDYVLCRITLDRSKDAKVNVSCPKHVSSCCNDNPKTDKKTANVVNEEVVMTESLQIFKDSVNDVAPIPDFKLTDTDHNIGQGGGGDYNHGLVNDNQRCQEENNVMMTDENRLPLTWSENGIDEFFMTDENPLALTWAEKEIDEFFMTDENLQALTWSEKEIGEFMEEVLDNDNMQQQEEPMQDRSCIQVSN